MGGHQRRCFADRSDAAFNGGFISTVVSTSRHRYVQQVAALKLALTRPKVGFLLAAVVNLMVEIKCQRAAKQKNLDFHINLQMSDR